MVKVDLISEKVYDIINVRRTNVSLESKKKYIRKLRQQLTNVLNQGYAKVKVTDKFDFTKLVNPLNQGSMKEGFLWLANDLAVFDSKLGLLDEVGVEITYTKKY